MSDVGMPGGNISMFSSLLSGEVLDAVKKAHDAEHKVEKGQIPLATRNAIAEQKKPVLPAPTLKISKSELMALIQKLMISNVNQQSRTQTIATKATSQRLKALAKQNIKKLQKVAEKTHKSNIGGIIAQVFAWIAAAITVIASVVLAVVSLGGGSEMVGVALLAAAALTVTVTVLTQTGVMGKIAKAIAKPLEQMFESMGMPKRIAKIVSEVAAQAIIAVAIIATDIALTVASGGASTEEAVTATINKITKIATVAAKIAQATAAAAQVGEAGASVASATYKYQAEVTEANIYQNKAYVQRLQVLLQQEQDTLRKLVESLSTTYVRMDDMIKDTHKANAQMLSQWANA